MQVERHHEIGSAVRVLIGHRDGEAPVYLPGVVAAVLAADDRDYRLEVHGTSRATGRRWSPCAPECVLPAEANDGCPACQSGNVISAGRNASGTWKCVNCGLAFTDFGAAPEVTAYAVKQDEPAAAACDIWGNPIAPPFRRDVWFSTPGSR